ncbi:CLK2 [Bugula neritina]|uniref:Secretory carrier-associated membrane protein n=1 Tax=Bugula neritina TaxID=10212 RepID=A0A7J7KK23_BUGNE|nr:CLK2 [Bugula neritina]
MAAFDDSNPFADPEDSSVDTSGRTQAAPLDDYNPFAQQATAAASLPPPQVAPPVAAPAAATPARKEPFEDPPPYQPSAAQQVDTTELQRRQEELERKAAELQERENKLRERSMQGPKQNNFPPLPSCCPCKPCFFQDFELEIPAEFSKYVKLGYYTWIARSVYYLINFLISLGYIGTIQDSFVTGSTIGLALLFFLAFIPLSFLCWYRPLYKAFRSDSSISFFVFFTVSACQIISDIIAILGPSKTGYLGVLAAVDLLNNGAPVNKNLGYVILFVAAIAVPLLPLDLFLLIKVHRLYRTTDASFQKAQSEFTTGVLKNEGVRKAGAQLASDVATNAMSNNATASGNRY